MSINNVTISGNLTRDPDLRQTAGGMAVLDFGVAVNDRRKNSATGEWEDYPNFVDCTVFGKRAESLSGILSKGFKVCVMGKLRYSSWEAQDGSKRSKLEVIADDIDIMSQRQQGHLGNKPVHAAAAPAQAAQPMRQQQAAYQPAQVAAQPQLCGMPQPVPVVASIYDEDIPF